MNRYLDINCCMSQRQRDVRFRASDPELKNNAGASHAAVESRLSRKLTVEPNGSLPDPYVGTQNLIPLN